MVEQIKPTKNTKSKCWDLSHMFLKCIESEFSKTKTNYNACIEKYNDYSTCLNKK